METNTGGATTPPEPNGSTPPPAQPQKRKRGRPFGSTNKTAPPLPETPAADGSTAPPGGEAAAQPQRRRRRAAAVDTEKLARQLKGLHMMLAKLVGDPVMNLSDMEASMMADSFGAISREYDVALDGKTGAFIQLAGTLALVYGPRVVYLQNKKRAHKAQTIDGVATPVDGNASTATSSAH